MSMSRFLTKFGSSLVALYIAAAAPGIGATTPADERDPTPSLTTTTATTDGNPWHG